MTPADSRMYERLHHDDKRNETITTAVSWRKFVSIAKNIQFCAVNDGLSKRWLLGQCERSDAIGRGQSLRRLGSKLLLVEQGFCFIVYFTISVLRGHHSFQRFIQRRLLCHYRLNGCQPRRSLRLAFEAQHDAVHRQREGDVRGAKRGARSENDQLFDFEFAAFAFGQQQMIVEQ